MVPAASSSLRTRTLPGAARVRRGLIQLAWRFLLFQKDSALAQWFRSRTEGVKGAHKTKMIVEQPVRMRMR
jgi:hypothetical protein